LGTFGNSSKFFEILEKTWELLGTLQNSSKFLGRLGASRLVGVGVGKYGCKTPTFVRPNVTVTVVVTLSLIPSLILLNTLAFS
jgi:hypothetical protein